MHIKRKNLLLIYKNIFNKNKKTIIISALFLIISVAVFLFFDNLKNKQPKELYDVAVVVRDQVSSDPEDDKKSSLKTGNVLLAIKSGHRWSDTEKVSYLILKMNLSQEEFEKISEAKVRKLSKEEIKNEMEKFKASSEVTDDELDRFKDELKSKTEVVQARKYRIDMDEFKGFDPNMLIGGQPYIDKVYDWTIVEKVD